MVLRSCEGLLDLQELRRFYLSPLLEAFLAIVHLRTSGGGAEASGRGSEKKNLAQETQPPAEIPLSVVDQRLRVARPSYRAPRNC